ncbi:hypothetical protein [Pyxidicoccus xibeiensis]|uniref:hypothetical protein n=1 Tax=Pyxidicoccus xibeiensis TaxID=2906759 RepID=UPI0020A764EC|nr:hypothetical protein [Pyxidicoccus xibeiensis]MCP3138230.1 hypothetical protein [Pyxidicoccus xibeiensis]
MVRLKKLGRLAVRLMSGALALGAVACDAPDRQELRLADLKSATMHVTWQLEVVDDEGEGRYFRGVKVSFQGAPADCPTFAPDVRATLNGHEMTLVPSAQTEGTCELPAFVLDMSDVSTITRPASGEDLVELSDGRDVFRATLQNLAQYHGLSRLETREYPTQLSAGSTLTYDWSPATDFFEEEGDGAPAAAFTLRERWGFPLYFEHAEHVLSQDLKFEVPLPAWLRADEVLAQLEGRSRIPVLTCEGPAACEGRSRFSRPFHATVR